MSSQSALINIHISRPKKGFKTNLLNTLFKLFIEIIYNLPKQLLVALFLLWTRSTQLGLGNICQHIYNSV